MPSHDFPSLVSDFPKLKNSSASFPFTNLSSSLWLPLIISIHKYKTITDLHTVHTCTEPVAANVCKQSAVRLHTQVQHTSGSEETMSEFQSTQSWDQIPNSVHQLVHIPSLELLHSTYKEISIYS